MTKQMTEQKTGNELEFRFEQERTIDAPIEDVFDVLLEHVGPEFVTPEAKPLSLVLEPFPGGRWYRDLGERTGHLWGHVQSIKRPTLLELTGPLFMSQPACNNVQYRLSESGGKTVLRLVHAAFGLLPEELRDGMPRGWEDQLERIERRCARTDR